MMIKVICLAALVGTSLALPVVDEPTELIQGPSEVDLVCPAELGPISPEKVTNFFASITEKQWKDTDSDLKDVTINHDGSVTFVYKGVWGITNGDPTITVTYDKSSTPMHLVKKSGNIKCLMKVDGIEGDVCSVIAVDNGKSLSWRSHVDVRPALTWFGRRMNSLFGDIESRSTVEFHKFCAGLADEQQAAEIVELQAEAALDSHVAAGVVNECKGANIDSLRSFLTDATTAEWKDTSRELKRVEKPSAGHVKFVYNGGWYTKTDPTVTVEIVPDATKTQYSFRKVGGNIECLMEGNVCSKVIIDEEGESFTWDSKVDVTKTLKWWAKGLNWLFGDMRKETGVDMDLFCNSERISNNKHIEEEHAPCSTDAARDDPNCKCSQTCFLGICSVKCHPLEQ